MARKSLQEKVVPIYERLKDDFYLGRDDLTVGNDRFNSALLFGTLTELNRGNMLLFGEYGGGKTTSAEYLHCLFNGLPLDLIKGVSIRGNPQLTEEKIVGRPDYGSLHGQEEKVIWQNFVLVGPKIFDEFNRVPESNQSMVLNGVDRGDWNYLNDVISTGSQPFFATCNYADRGNNELIPPLLDRFDVAVESKFPGVSNSLAISMDYNNDKDGILKNPELTERALKILNSKKSYGEIQKELKKISREYFSYLSNQDVPILNEDERNDIGREVKSLSLDKDSLVYFAFLISEMNTCPRYGQKRSIDKLVRDQGFYLNNAFTGSGSRRSEKAIIKYSKSLAWLQGKDEVNLEHLTQIAPYILWHRLKWDDDLTSKLEENERRDPLNLYVAKLLIGEGSKEFPGVKKRFAESKDNYLDVLTSIKHNKTKQAIEKATEFSSNGKGHPIFFDIINDLQEEDKYGK